MNYTGTITDKTSRAVPGARISFFLPSGAKIDYQVAVDQNGDYSIDAGTDGGLMDPGNTLHFTAPGYYDYIIQAAQVPEYFRVWLEPKVNKQLLVGIGIAAAVGLLLLDKKAVSGIGKKLSGEGDIPNWVMPAAAIGVGAYLVIHFFAKDGKGEDSAQIQSAAAAKIAELKSQGIVPTISSAVAEGLSSKIVQAADNCGTDESAINDAFASLSNEADFWLLMKVYGVRQYKSCFDGNWLTDSSYNLPQTIASELSSWARSDVNEILAARNINYQF